VAALTNTLTALTLAGVPVKDTSVEEVVISLRRIVVVTSDPAEAEVDFAMIPGNPLRPRAFEVPPGVNDSPTFEVRLRDTELSRQKPGAAVETVHLTIQSGTVTSVPAIVDADLVAVPPDEIDYNALQPDIFAELVGKKIPSFGWWLQNAKCETGINWKNGGKYAGAFGIYVGSWLQWGGGYLAPTPDQATPEEQILIIIRITTTGWRLFDKYVPPAGFMMNTCFRPLTWTVYEG
jgi:hypothetical protein